MEEARSIAHTKEFNLKCHTVQCNISWHWDLHLYMADEVLCQISDHECLRGLELFKTKLA